MTENALRQLIVTNAVGIGANVFPSTEVGEIAKALPKVAYTLIRSSRDYTDDGSTGLVDARYQLDVFAATMTQGRAIADAIRGGMDNYRGTLDGTTIVRLAFPDGETWQTADVETAAGKQSVARVRMDVRVTYREV